MKRPPKKENSVLDGLWRFVIIAGLFAFLSEFIIFLISLNKSIPLQEMRTMVLTSSVLFQLFFIYTCRSDKPLHKIGIFSNRYLNYAIFWSIVLHLALIYTPINTIMGLSPLTGYDWLLILPFAFSGVVLFEVWKMWKEWGK